MKKNLCSNANNWKNHLQSKVSVASYLGMALLLNVFAHSMCAAEVFSPGQATEALTPDKTIVVPLKEEIAQNSEAIFDATAPNKSSATTENLNSIIVEFRVSYFQPFSKSFRKLTGEGVTYGLETTIPVWKGLNIWGEIDYFSKDGKMSGIDRTGHITLVPVTLGLKYVYYFNRYYGLYGGAAGKYYFVEEVNRVFPMHKTSHRNGLGGVVEIGNLICFNHFVIDIFSSWSFKKIKGPHHLPPNAESFSMQVGGWNIGAGLGYKF